MPWGFRQLAAAATSMYHRAGEAAAHVGAAWSGPSGPAEGANAGSGQLHGGANVIQRAADFGRGLLQEGPAAFADLSGVMDRQAMQREIADRFTIGDERALAAEHASNVVSQKEVQQIARVLSDVRLGRGDLTIDAGYHDSARDGQGNELHGTVTDAGAQEAYRAGAMNDLVALMQTTSGRHEVERLHDNGPGRHQHTTLAPLVNADGQLDRTDGVSLADDPDSVTTPGRGSSVHVLYNPGVNLGDNFPIHVGNDFKDTNRSDVILAHELNHSINQTAGTLDGTPVAAGEPGHAAHMANDARFHFEDGSPLLGMEHQAVGIGKHAGEDMTEDAYRMQRLEMARLHARGLIQSRPGRRDGDANMVRREGYEDMPTTMEDARAEAMRTVLAGASFGGPLDPAAYDGAVRLLGGGTASLPPDDWGPNAH